MFFKGVFMQVKNHKSSLSASSKEDDKANLCSPMSPDGPVEHIALDGEDRLILPNTTGQELNKIDKEFWNEKNKIDLFISIIHALQKAHEKDLIMLHLKADNIKYDQKTKTCFFIDSGASIKKGDVLSDTYLCSTTEILNQSRTQHTQIAPECWYLPKSHPLPAKESMDVFSLAALFHCLSNGTPISPLLAWSLRTCGSKDPLIRPSLENLLNAFTRAQSRYKEDLQTVRTLLLNGSLDPSSYNHLIQGHLMQTVLFNLNQLKEHNLVTQNSLELINKPNIDLSSVTDLLILLTIKNLPNTPARHKELVDISSYLNRDKFKILSESITLLYGARLLTLPNFIAAANEGTLNDFLKALSSLRCRGLLNEQASQSDLDPMISCPKHHEAAIVWGLLRTAGLSSHYETVMSRPDLNEFVFLLKALENSALLDTKNLEKLLKDQDPKSLAGMLIQKKIPFLGS
jgi:serine/threonine protein kinase